MEFEIGNYPKQITQSVGVPCYSIYGGGVLKAQFSATLTLNSDGTCTFSGGYDNLGELPGPFSAPTQNYSVSCALVANGRAFTFNNSNTCQNDSRNSWYVSVKNAMIAANWPEIVQSPIVFNSKNSVTPGQMVDAITGAIESAVRALGTTISNFDPAISVIGTAIEQRTWDSDPQPWPRNFSRRSGGRLVSSVGQAQVCVFPAFRLGAMTM